MNKAIVLHKDIHTEKCVWKAGWCPKENDPYLSEKSQCAGKARLTGL